MGFPGSGAMVYGLLAEFLVLVHLAFVLFVVAGGLLVLWRPTLCWIHIPAVVWGALIEFTGWICPLTPWEQALRLKAGQLGYTGGFIDHYISPILYPAGLTPDIQVVLGILVVGVNGGIYAFVWYRRARTIKAKGTIGAEAFVAPSPRSLPHRVPHPEGTRCGTREREEK